MVELKGLVAIIQGHKILIGIEANRIRKQAQLGVPHSTISVDDIILQAETY